MSETKGARDAIDNLVERTVEQQRKTTGRADVAAAEREAIATAKRYDRRNKK